MNTEQQRYSERNLRHCAEVLDELILRVTDLGLTATEITELGRARDFVATTANTLKAQREGRATPAIERRQRTAAKKRRKAARQRARASRRQNR